MKFGWILTTVMITGLPVMCAEKMCVTARLQNSSEVPRKTLFSAQFLSMKLFKKIGIFLKWGEAFERKADSKCPEVLMEFDSNAPRALLPGALAYANPYMTSGTRIRIFIDRVFGGHRTGARAEALLGYVMAHEIGHILQGISRHSDEGVMREQIPEAIHLEAELRFTDDDVYLIRTGLSKLAESN